MCKESAYNAGDPGEVGLIPGSGRPPGGGNGNPLQYSCLENPMDRGIWQATVHGVAESRTRLSNWALTHTMREHSHRAELWEVFLKISQTRLDLNLCFKLFCGLMLSGNRDESMNWSLWNSDLDVKKHKVNYKEVHNLIYKGTAVTHICNELWRFGLFLRQYSCFCLYSLIIIM